MREIDYTYLPDDIRDELRDYVEKGVRPREWLDNAIKNDFRGAVLAVEPEQLEDVRMVAVWLYAECPAFSQGEYTDNWVTLGGQTRCNMAGGAPYQQVLDFSTPDTD